MRCLKNDYNQLKWALNLYTIYTYEYVVRVFEWGNSVENNNKINESSGFLRYRLTVKTLNYN